MNVVLLDLDQGARRIEVAALRYGGYDVATAHTLEQVITHVRAHLTDAILVDPAHVAIGPLGGPLISTTAQDRPAIVSV